MLPNRFECPSINGHFPTEQRSPRASGCGVEVRLTENRLFFVRLPLKYSGISHLDWILIRRSTCSAKKSHISELDTFPAHFSSWLGSR